MRILSVSIAGCFLGVAALAASNNVTFNKDVLPVLQKNCQECHRPGEVAPMSLLTYSEARPWAKALKAAVVTQKMPPWFADPKYGHFANDRRLSPEEIEVISAWADNGSPEGDAKDKPAPLTFAAGWKIKPDMVIEMPEAFPIPAKGTINYQYIRVKGNITQDLWVEGAEMRPSNPKVLHHGKVWVVPPGSKWMADAVPGKPYEGKETGRNDAMDGNDILGKFNPGLGAQSFDIGGSAKMIPKGSDFIFELHYTTSGVATSDTSKVGIVFAKSKPMTRYYLSPGTPAALNMVITETGADKAVAKVLPVLAGKLSGNAVRVPTPDVSLAILNLSFKKETTKEGLNELLRTAALKGPLVEQIQYLSSNEVVSSDLIGNPCASIVDSAATIVHKDGKSAVLYIWYDNEYGYSRQVLRFAKYISNVIRLTYY